MLLTDRSHHLLPLVGRTVEARHERADLLAPQLGELLAEQATGFFFGERARRAPSGAAGGKPAALDRFTFPGPDGTPMEPPMGSKIVGIKLVNGQRVRLETPGGGGWGAPGG